MNEREQARFDMIKRVGIFGANNTSDFSGSVTPNTNVTPAQTKAKQLLVGTSAAAVEKHPEA